MPPELLSLARPSTSRCCRRDPHYLPAAGGLRVAVAAARARSGGDPARSSSEFFSAADARPTRRWTPSSAALRDDLAPAWLAEPDIGRGDRRALHPPGAARARSSTWCRGSVADYLATASGSTSELLLAMYAVTDGLSGLHAGPDDPGTGHNFLVHNMCRLPGADGTWMIVRGGMGTVAARSPTTARRRPGRASSPGRSGRADHHRRRRVDRRRAHRRPSSRSRATVVARRLRPVPLRAWSALRAARRICARDWTAVRRPGTTMKVNLALARPAAVPAACREAPSPFGATMHLLPGEDAPDERGPRDVGATSRPAGCRTSRPSSGTCTPPSTPRCTTPRATTPRRCSCSRSRTSPRGSTWDAELTRYVAAPARHLRPLRARHHDLGGRHVPAAPARIEAALRHHAAGTSTTSTTRSPSTPACPTPPASGPLRRIGGLPPGGLVIGAAGHNAARRILM